MGAAKSLQWFELQLLCAVAVVDENKCASLWGNVPILVPHSHILCLRHKLPRLKFNYRVRPSILGDLGQPLRARLSKGLGYDDTYSAPTSWTSGSRIRNQRPSLGCPATFYWVGSIRCLKLGFAVLSTIGA